MSILKYPHLFEPVRIGGALFRNRIFASPTGHQALTPEGFVTPDVIAYYERKAIGGAAAVTVGEGIVDSKRGKGGQWHVTLDDPRAAHGLCRLTDAVNRHGAVASVELQHAGMYANRSLSFMGAASKGVAYGPVECELDGRHILQMTEEIIEETIEAFASAALFAKQCGFGMVTVHAGHGWLLTQFLSPMVNTRKDKWGGSPDNRARFPVAVCDAIRKACGPNFPIEIRISGSECFDGGYDIDEGVRIAQRLDGHADLIHVSAGQYTGPYAFADMFVVTHPSMFQEDGCNVKYAAEVKKHIRTPVATVGALSDPELLEEIIASGKADVVELARALICDPDLPNKARTGCEADIRKCMRCFTCFSNIMNTWQLCCSINPVIGRELEFSTQPLAAEKKTVLVAGGGIAGMQAALTASRRGHEVILCEKSGKLGGVLQCEKDVPFKKHLAEYLELTARQVRESAIDLWLETAVTPELAARLKPDVIIAALGARPVIPRIPGIDRANVAGAEDVFNAPHITGKKAVILGAGLVGVELGIHLAMLGRKVEIIEMADKINLEGNHLHGIALGVQLKKYDIPIRLNTKAVEVNEKGVVCEGPDGRLQYEADTVIYAVGQTPLRAEADALRFCAPEFYQVGDCLTPKNMYQANRLAFNAAMDIGKALL